MLKMMLPGQIKNYSLTMTKQGTYKASDVETFRQNVYASFCELVSENNALKDKFVSLSDLVNEYNAGKNSIATALIKSQSLADQTVTEAQAKAQEIIAEAEKEAQRLADERIAQADKYYEDKTSEAEEYLKRAETELDRVIEQVSKKADEYVAKVNMQAAQVITSANEQASKIVSRAYVDAKKARDMCDDIISSAVGTLPEIKAEIDSFKSQTRKLLNIILQSIDAIDVPNDIEFNYESDSLDGIDVPQITDKPEPFSLNDFQMNPEEPVEVTYEDIDESDDMDFLSDDNTDSDIRIFNGMSGYEKLFDLPDSKNNSDETDADTSDNSEDLF